MTVSDTCIWCALQWVSMAGLIVSATNILFMWFSNKSYYINLFHDFNKY